MSKDENRVTPVILGTEIYRLKLGKFKKRTKRKKKKKKRRKSKRK